MSIDADLHDGPKKQVTVQTDWNSVCQKQLPTISEGNNDTDTIKMRHLLQKQNYCNA